MRHQDLLHSTWGSPLKFRLGRRHIFVRRDGIGVNRVVLYAKVTAHDNPANAMREGSASLAMTLRQKKAT